MNKNVSHSYQSIFIEFHNLLVQLCDQYGELNGIVRLWLGPFLPMLIICDVKVAQVYLTIIDSFQLILTR